MHNSAIRLILTFNLILKIPDITKGDFERILETTSRSEPNTLTRDFWAKKERQPLDLEVRGNH